MVDADSSAVLRAGDLGHSVLKFFSEPGCHLTPILYQCYLLLSLHNRNWGRHWLCLLITISYFNQNGQTYTPHTHLYVLLKKTRNTVLEFYGYSTRHIQICMYVPYTFIKYIICICHFSVALTEYPNNKTS